MANSRRLMYIAVTPESVLSFMQNTRPVQCVGNPVPEDAKVVNSEYNFGRHAFILTLESAAFELVEEGKMIPEMPPCLFKVWEK